MKRLIIALFALCGCTNADIGYEYLDTPYKSDPLGEEKLPDADPLIRTDAFDCTTFVETVLADGDVEKLNKIRYKDGNVDFLSRNHFIEIDWLPNNSDVVQDVTADYGKTAVRNVMIDKKNWFKIVHGIDTDFSKKTVSLNYIPYNELKAIRPTEPLIVLFITGKSEKSGKIGTDLAVVHMGFLLPDGKLRHASSQYGKVMDTDFYEYAMNRAKNKQNIGIMLVSIK